MRAALWYRAGAWRWYLVRMGLRVLRWPPDGPFGRQTLFADGSVSKRATAEANQGWDPGEPNRPFALRFGYVPRAWEPPVVERTGPSLGAETSLLGRQAFTRMGIAGRDFDGPEVR